MSHNSYKKPDFWSRKAFAEGYPARSVYKLSEIIEKFNFSIKSATSLDLGSAPGGWTRFLLKNSGERGKVISCDLNPLDEDVCAKNLFFFQGDMNCSEMREKIREKGPYDFVVCDAAPLTTGNRTVDCARSENLAKMAFWYAQNMLKAGGNFVAKIFQSGAERELLFQMRSFFSSAKMFKPAACRKESFETYLIGIESRGG